MISLTKICRFEAAHAIFDYNGDCARLHGHSYELHVCVESTKMGAESYISGNGMIIDLKLLKSIIQKNILSELDHKTLLSDKYVNNRNLRLPDEETIILPVEPTVENILLYIKIRLQSLLPDNIRLCKVELYETRDSMARWTHN